jgi:hypothetical protein
LRYLLLILAIAACSPAPETREAIKQAVGDARTKPRIVVQIRLIEPGYPTEKDLELRLSIEKKIEEQHIGAVVAQEAAEGHMDVTIEVDSTMEAIPRVEDLLREAGVKDRTTIRVIT